MGQSKEFSLISFSLPAYKNLHNKYPLNEDLATMQGTLFGGFNLGTHINLASKGQGP